MQDFKGNPKQFQEIQSNIENFQIVKPEIEPHSLNVSKDRNVIKGFKQNSNDAVNNDSVSNCKYCNSEFQAYNIKQVFCSKSCRMKWHKENNGFDIEKHLHVKK